VHLEEISLKLPTLTKYDMIHPVNTLFGYNGVNLIADVNT
jgi:hypothetical protein